MTSNQRDDRHPRARAGTEGQDTPGDDGRRQDRQDVPGEEGPSPSVPSSLDFDRSASAARTGRDELRQREALSTETGPGVTGGDVDADWGSAYAVGDEAPGGDNPTPDQDIVDEIGRSLGVEYEDNEELKGADKIESRDRNRWELDPASSEDYAERNREEDRDRDTE